MPRRSPKISHQEDDNLARLAREVQAQLDDLDSRLDDLENAKVLETALYVQGPLYLYLQGLAAHVVFGAPPQPPE